MGDVVEYVCQLTLDVMNTRRVSKIKKTSQATILDTMRGTQLVVTDRDTFQGQSFSRLVGLTRSKFYARRDNMLSQHQEIRPITEEEMHYAFDLEKTGYPEDEYATFDNMMYRRKEAPELTIGYFDNGVLVGFIAATRYHGVHLTEESMKMHVPNGESVCIHSICVHKHRRRQGIAVTLLEWFMEHIKRNQMGASRVLLITHANLIPLYKRVGFVLVSKSEVVHGKEPWYEFETRL